MNDPERRTTEGDRNDVLNVYTEGTSVAAYQDQRNVIASSIIKGSEIICYKLIRKHL